MKHILDVEIAKVYGVYSAILLENLGYWIKQNEANDTNFFDGTYWTYNSRRAYREMFPYMSERQINTAFQKLIDAGLVITGNYNKLAYDRTLWYALTQKGKCILHFDIMDDIILSNGTCQNVEPIPNINTDINTNINTDKRDGESKRKGRKKKSDVFVPPTLEEVQEYVKSRNSSVDPKRFFDYFDAGNWIDSKGNPVKNWRQKLITWEKHANINDNKTYGQNGVAIRTDKKDDLEGIF